MVKTDSLSEIKAALEEIGKLVDLIDCSNKDNLLLLPLFLAQQKRAAAALTQMEPALIRNAALEKAAQAATGYFLFRTEDTEDVYHVCEAIAARIRAFKEQP